MIYYKIADRALQPPISRGRRVTHILSIKPLRTGFKELSVKWRVRIEKVSRTDQTRKNRPRSVECSRIYWVVYVGGPLSKIR